MSDSYLIDGVGDEVTIVLGVFLAIFVVIVSWMSTRVNDGDSRQYDVNITANAAAEIIGSRQSQQTPLPDATDASESAQDQPSTSHAQSSDNSDPASTDRSSEPANEQGTSTNEASQHVDGAASVLRQRHGLSSADTVHSESTVNSGENTPSTSSTPAGSVTIRLKFMDDTIRTVQAQPDDTLETFRRNSFPADVARRYRLIFQGQVLRDPTQTLRQLRVVTDSTDSSASVPVIHCFLSPTAATEGGNAATSATHQLEMAAEELHIGSLLLPLLGLALACLWYLCIFHTSLFSIQSVVSIVGFSLLYIALIVNQFVL